MQLLLLEFDARVPTTPHSEPLPGPRKARPLTQQPPLLLSATNESGDGEDWSH